MLNFRPTKKVFKEKYCLQNQASGEVFAGIPLPPPYNLSPEKLPMKSDYQLNFCHGLLDRNGSLHVGISAPQFDKHVEYGLTPIMKQVGKGIPKIISKNEKFVKPPLPPLRRDPSPQRGYPKNPKTGEEDIWLALAEHQKEVVSKY